MMIVSKHKGQIKPGLKGQPGQRAPGCLTKVGIFEKDTVVTIMVKVNIFVKQ